MRSPLIECGGHSTSIGEPVAGPDVLSPQHYRKYPWKHERRMVEELKARGVVLHNHICGNTLPIADDFIATDAEVLEIDHKTNARALKAKARGKTTLLGNIDTGLFYSGTPAEVEAACREAIEVDGAGCRVHSRPRLRSAPTRRGKYPCAGRVGKEIRPVLTEGSSWNAS